ncbi:RsfA family transcriptional regulator [Niallia taxi]|uniref:RsfA family transcriptional regulator n=1 Tax=Niallia taxi TaxID=2499688 RepID=UPI003D29A689
MPKTRQDSWTEKEDILLADVVLQSISDGSTQLQAFEEVGKQLSRTSAACGFRWNSYVRRQFKSEIEAAKAKRKQIKIGRSLVETSITEPSSEEGKVYEEINNHQFEGIVHYLKEIYNKSKLLDHHRKVGDSPEKELKKKINGLSKQNNDLQKELHSKEEAYKGLVDLMEQARRMVENK